MALLQINNVLDLLVSRPSLPDIQWDGHDRVEDDDVGPEGEEAGENSAALELIPQQKYLEVSADPALPDRVSNGQNNSHTDEEGKDLKYTSSFYVHFFTSQVILLRTVYKLYKIT